MPRFVVIGLGYVDDLMKDVGLKPQPPIEEGIDKFIKWYQEYYKI